MKILERLGNGESIKSLKIEELNILASEIREFLVEKVSETGGHLASNLGVVELTIALHYVYDFPADKIVFDVGHQAYVHKILSGRANQFDTLRKFKGLAGFPKREESEYDSFNTGHASTSISAALGIVKARELSHKNHEVIAFIGDGSLGGGLAYEAINDAGNSNKKILIILNDNEMSISKNVGAMSRHLNSIRTSGRYFKIKQSVLAFLEKREQKKLVAFIRSIKNTFKRALMSNTVFEGLGLTYFGPFEGHNIASLIKTLRRIKRLNEPIIMHVRTVKGKGYAPAEQKPSEFHGVAKFDKNAGDIKKSICDYSGFFGKTLEELAEKNEKIVAITAAMPDGTGLKHFAEKFPDRFFDVGIAEEHAVTVAAGMSTGGIVPVVAIYSTFFQRAFDQILHDVCLQNLHVVFCADRAGLVGADGETHQGIFDLSFMRLMPSVTILAPADFSSLAEMLDYAVNKHDGPIFIRYPRGTQKKTISYSKPFALSEAEVLREGNDVCIVACGNMVQRALEVSEKIMENNISVTVIDVRTVFPIDMNTIVKSSEKSKLIVTLEDNIIKGGMGEEILYNFNELGINKKILIKGYKTGKIEHGSIDELEKLHNMDCDSVANEILKKIKEI